MRPNAKVVKVLKAARKHLASSDSEADECSDSSAKPAYICHAIELAYHVDPDLYLAGRRVKDLIHERLQGYSSLEGWLMEYGGVSNDDLTYDRWDNKGRKRQATRLAWVNSMISEFGGTP